MLVSFGLYVLWHIHNAGIKGVVLNTVSCNSRIKDN